MNPVSIEWAPLPHDAATGEHRMEIVLGRAGHVIKS
jgi:hypothetical protein